MEGERGGGTYILTSLLSIPTHILVNTDLQTVSFTDIHFLYAGYICVKAQHMCTVPVNPSLPLKYAGMHAS